MVAFARTAQIAAILAAIGSLGGLIGALASVVLGALAAGIAVRRAVPDPAPFRSWLICTTLFAAFVVAMIPLAEHTAVTLGLLLFSSVFGTQVYLIDRAVGVVIDPSRKPTQH